MTKTVIISGSRHFTEYNVVRDAIEASPFFGNIDHVHVGDAQGVDALALRWCKENGITYTKFRTNWGFYGRGAGPERNKEMILYGGEALILIWDGKSKGSANMKREAKKHLLPVFEWVVQDD